MKKILLLLLIIVLLLPSVSIASPYDDLVDNIRVFELKIMGQGELNLDMDMNRAELATVAVRLMGIEYLKDFQNSSSLFSDVKGWAVPYVNIVNDLGLMKGSGDNLFNPNGKVKYMELLTVLMRILGYEDGFDFKIYPEDYYSKSLEIGLGNLYIPHNEVVTRGIVAGTINKALDLKMKNSDKVLSSLQFNYFPQTDFVVKNPIVENTVYLKDFSFNSSIVGVFSGTIKGVSDFSGYKMVLLSKSGNILKSVILGKDGSFSIEGFDVSSLSKIQGYKYEVYSSNGSLILWDNLN